MSPALAPLPRRRACPAVPACPPTCALFTPLAALCFPSVPHSYFYVPGEKEVLIREVTKITDKLGL